MFSNIYLFKRAKYLYSNKLYSLKNTLEDLINDSEENLLLENINFEDTNGLTCQLTINVDYDLATDEYLYYNYCYNTTDNTRWFITACTKPRQAQYVYTLVRDVIIDYYDGIIHSDAIIKRANQITPVTGLAQYKKTMNLSQIKKREIVLDDGVGKGWIYVYIAKNGRLTAQDGYFKIPKVQNAWNTTFTLTDAIISELSTKKLMVMSDMYAWFYIENKETNFWMGITKDDKYKIKSNNSICTFELNDFDSIERHYINNNKALPSETTIQEFISANYQDYLTYIKSKSEYLINEDYNTLAGLNGQVIADTSGKLYTVNVTSYPSLTGEYFVNGTEDQSKAIADKFDWLYTGTSLHFNLVGQAYTITFTPVTEWSSYYYRIPISWINNRVSTNDCLYDIMAFPIECKAVTNFLADSGIPIENYGAVIDTSYTDTMNFVQALKTAMGDAIYDIQWLPYGPFDYDTNSTTGVGFYKLINKQGYTETKATFINTTETTTYTSDNTSSTHTGSQTNLVESHANQVSTGCCSSETVLQSNVAWINLSSNNYHKTVSKSVFTKSTNYLKNRIRNETTFLRLCGPNWNSTFEFSDIYNDGLNGYIIDMTLKPYNPFVRIQPLFGGLYGSNYNDPRGLILKGDFSIEQTTEAYRNYQLNNRNYDLIFNRNLQSLDLKNSVALRSDSLNTALDSLSIVTGAISGASSGAITGAMTGNAIGAGAGAITGAVTGVVGGVADLAINNQIRDMNKSLRLDQRDATLKQYQYQLGNIVALPDTLTRSSSFDAMYRVYPVLEVYSCSDEEKAQLNLSIKWNGLEINQMSTLKEQIEYQSGELFISAELLRFYGSSINDQIYAAINERLSSGIYIERS